MSHLTLEALARLVDETPEATEAAHLRSCPTCSGELEALRGDAAELGALPAPEPPAHAWEHLEARLLAEGLVRRPRRAAAWPVTLLRMAAALVLFVAGAASSSYLLRSGEPAGPGTLAAGDPAGAPATSPEGVPMDAADATPPTLPAGTGTDAGAPGQEEGAGSRAPSVTDAAPPASRRGDVRLAGLEQGDRATPPRQGGGSGPLRTVASAPRTVEEAAAWLQVAERDYMNALTHYAELTGQARTGDPVSRLAALEAITMTTRAALGYAPADPIINGYHLSAVAERDATLRQIAATTTNSWF